MVIGSLKGHIINGGAHKELSCKAIIRGVGSNLGLVGSGLGIHRQPMLAGSGACKF